VGPQEAYYKLSRKYPPLSQDAIQFVECAIQTLEVIAHGVADPEVAEHMRGKTPEEHSAYEEQMLTVYNLLAALATQRGMSLSRVEVRRHWFHHMRRELLFCGRESDMD
jgi:hypothetical protein